MIYNKNIKNILWYIFANIIAILNIILIKYLFIDENSFANTFFVKGLITALIAYFIIIYKKISIKNTFKDYYKNAFIWVLTSFLWYYPLQFIPLNEGLNIRFISPVFAYFFSLYILKEKQYGNSNIIILLINIIFISVVIFNTAEQNLQTYFYYFLIFLSCITASYRYVKFKQKENKEKILLTIFYYSLFEMLITAPFIKINLLPQLFTNSVTYIMVFSFFIYLFILNKAYEGKLSDLEPYHCIRLFLGYLACYFLFRENVNIFYIAVTIFTSNLLFVIKKYENSLRKQIEIEKSLRLELEKLSAEKNNMFVQIVHDLKTPVSIIQMSNNILSEECQKHNDKNMDKFAKYIETNTDKLYSNINNILKLEKINDLDDIKLNIKNVNLKDLINKSISEIKPIITIKNIILKSDLEDLSLNTDEEKLKIVIDNILSNAIKFTKSNIKIKTYTSDKYINISFKNDGYNIDKKELENITQKISTKTGTGYGLNIIKKILNLINGNMIIENIKENNYSVEFLIELKK